VGDGLGDQILRLEEKRPVTPATSGSAAAYMSVRAPFSADPKIGRRFMNRSNSPTGPLMLLPNAVLLGPGLTAFEVAVVPSRRRASSNENRMLLSFDRWYA
jgi:hypothetical protein